MFDKFSSFKCLSAFSQSTHFIYGMCKRLFRFFMENLSLHILCVITCVYFKMNYINLKFYNVFLFQTQYHVRVTVTPQGENKHCQMSVLSCMKIEVTSMYSNYTEDRVLYRVDDDSFWAVSGKSAGILKNTLFFTFIENYICRYNVRTKRI